MTDQRPSENTDGYPKFPTMVGMFGARHAETPTVDHKAEAEEILANRGSMNDPNGLALAHAVMYLAEQQHTANLLAFAQFDHTAEGGARLYTNFETAIKLRAQAGEALGVDA